MFWNLRPLRRTALSRTPPRAVFRLIFCLALLAAPISSAQEAMHLYRPRSVEELNTFIRTHARDGVLIVGGGFAWAGLEAVLLEALKGDSARVRVLTPAASASTFAGLIKAGASVRTLPSARSKPNQGIARSATSLMLVGAFTVLPSKGEWLVLESPETSLALHHALEQAWTISQPVPK